MGKKRKSQGYHPQMGQNPQKRQKLDDKVWKKPEKVIKQTDLAVSDDLEVVIINPAGNTNQLNQYSDLEELKFDFNSKEDFNPDADQ